MKRAYYRLSLDVHPDRVGETEKKESTEKFKVLTKINEVLVDQNKRKLYDQEGIIEDDNELNSSVWLSMWKQFFKPSATTDIVDFKEDYTGN